MTWWFNLLFGTKLTDVLSGMYAFRREAVEGVDFSTRGFSIEAEIAAYVASTGDRICELPIVYRRRVGGKKLKPLHGLYIFRGVFELAV